MIVTSFAGLGTELANFFANRPIQPEIDRFIDLCAALRRNIASSILENKPNLTFSQFDSTYNEYKKIGEEKLNFMQFKEKVRTAMESAPPTALSNEMLTLQLNEVVVNVLTFFDKIVDETVENGFSAEVSKDTIEFWFSCIALFTKAWKHVVVFEGGRIKALFFRHLLRKLSIMFTTLNYYYDFYRQTVIGTGRQPIVIDFKPIVNQMICDKNMIGSDVGECAQCQSPKATKKCSKCAFMRYCNAECQKKHWNEHKLHCGKETIEEVRKRLARNPPWY